MIYKLLNIGISILFAENDTCANICRPICPEHFQSKAFVNLVCVVLWDVLHLRTFCKIQKIGVCVNLWLAHNRNQHSHVIEIDEHVLR